MRYSRRTSSYPYIIASFDSTHILCMTDLVAINVETLRIDSGCSLEKELNELIHINLSMVSYQILNQVDSCHSCVRDPLA